VEVPRDVVVKVKEKLLCFAGSRRCTRAWHWST